MWYFILDIAFAIWVLMDGNKRGVKSPILWMIGAFFLWPFVLPFYVAKRPLKAGERREGGTAWNVLKCYALFWTILMGAFTLSYMVSITSLFSSLDSGAEQIGGAIGFTIAMGIIGAIWFFPLVGALVLGLFLKQSSFVEVGSETEPEKSLVY